MTAAATRRPRLGFLGLGWIGRRRLEALVATGEAEIVALADSDPAAVSAAAALAGGARPGATLDDVLAARPDGVVIATPSALHAAQTVAALQAGAAVFCQKPLGRTAREAAAAVEAARAADRLLAVDLSYRHTAAVVALREAMAAGRIGTPRIADLTFHNAYGPDKPWFRDRALSGGGCLVDLGVHLIDLALWLQDWPEVTCTSAQLFAGGRRITADAAEVEDFAAATLETADGALIRIACSWNLPAGCDAVIRAEIYGDRGGLSVTNVDGSFVDFAARFHDGCRTEPLTAPPDVWGGRAAVAWMRQLARGEGFDPEAQRLVTLGEAIDKVYALA